MYALWRYGHPHTVGADIVTQKRSWHRSRASCVHNVLSALIYILLPSILPFVLKL